MSAVLVFAPLILALVFVMIWNVTIPRLLNHLETHHSSKWESLSRPRYLEWRYEPMVSLIQYLWQRQYLTVNDTQLRQLGARARLSLLGTFVSAVAFCSLGGLVQFALK